MLRSLLKQIRMLWIVLRALRTGISGAVLVTVVGLCVAPASDKERDLLARQTESPALITLVTHRAASLMVKVDSDRLYTAIAEGAPEDLSPWQVRFVIERFADGTVQVDGDGDVVANVPGVEQQAQSSSRNLVTSLVPPTPSEGLLAPRTNSAKFVSARSN